MENSAAGVQVPVPGRSYWYRWSSDCFACKGKCLSVCEKKAIIEPPTPDRDARVVSISDIHCEVTAIPITPKWWQFWKRHPNQLNLDGEVSRYQDSY